MRSRDTSPEAHQIQIEAYRAMGLEGRLVLAAEMAEFGQQLAAAGVRLRHPDYDEHEVEWALRRLRLRDDELYRAVWPDAPLLAP